MKEISVKVNNKQIVVPDGATVAIAVYKSGEKSFRKSVNGQARSALCGMGICYECRVEIDDQPHQRACQCLCRDGMEIKTQ